MSTDSGIPLVSGIRKKTKTIEASIMEAKKKYTPDPFGPIAKNI